MTASSPDIALLHELLALGERMQAALDAEDLSALERHLQARTALIERLRTHPPADPPPPARQALAARLERQAGRFEEALRRRQAEIAGEIEHQGRLRRAGRGYDQTTAPRPGVLNHHVCG